MEIQRLTELNRGQIGVTHTGLNQITSTSNNFSTVRFNNMNDNEEI
jgi:hypothetical protein